jgi:uncharacterized protein YdeI (YjbR/CyaY-like superfamily)
MVTSVDAYMADGCGRCDYFATPQCKVREWQELLETLREVVLQSGLEEVVKWGSPCYMYENHNICMIGALRTHCSLSFFKGVLLTDVTEKLEFAGEHSRIAKFIRFNCVEEVTEYRPLIHEFIRQAVDIERQGLKPQLSAASPPMPEELLQMMNEDYLLRDAFYSLTPGRQRGYILFFSQAKQSATRRSRIESSRVKILQGKGLQDR